MIMIGVTIALLWDALGNFSSFVVILIKNNSEIALVQISSSSLITWKSDRFIVASIKANSLGNMSHNSCSKYASTLLITMAKIAIIPKVIKKPNTLRQLFFIKLALLFIASLVVVLSSTIIGKVNKKRSATIKITT